MSAKVMIDTRALAKKIRIHALRMTSRGGGSHVGAIYSCADILAVLYGGILNVDSAFPEKADRDRFVLSKGHAGGGLYAALADRGYAVTYPMSFRGLRFLRVRWGMVCRSPRGWLTREFCRARVTAFSPC